MFQKTIKIYTHRCCEIWLSSISKNSLWPMTVKKNKVRAERFLNCFPIVAHLKIILDIKPLRICSER